MHGIGLHVIPGDEISPVLPGSGAWDRLPWPMEAACILLVVLVMLAMRSWVKHCGDDMGATVIGYLGEQVDLEVCMDPIDLQQLLWWKVVG